MAVLPAFYVQQLLVFAMVLARVSGMVLAAPVFGSSAVPARVRALLAFSLATLIMPLEWGRTVASVTTVDLMIRAGAELLIGLSLGLGILVLFSGMQIAGQVIAQLSGMQLADVAGGASESAAPVFSQLLHYVALGVFVLIGGHRQLIVALLDTFAWLPPGSGGISHSLSETVVGLLSQSFVLGVRASAAGMTALLLAALILGLLSRVLPQINILALGLGLNALIALGALSVTLGTAAWMFQEQIDPVLDTLIRAIRTSSG